MVIDYNLLKRTINGVPYHVRYALWNSKEIKKFRIKELVKELPLLKFKQYTHVYEDNSNNKFNIFDDVCFASLGQNVSKFNSNRMLYFVDSKGGLTKKQKKEWVRLCKKHKFLPDYIPLTSSDYDCLLLNFDKTPYEGDVYHYLVAFRNLREFQELIANTLYLVIDCGVNFYIAYTYCSKLNCMFMGHNIGQFASNIYTNPKDLTIRAKDVLVFYLFLNKKIALKQKKLSEVSTPKTSKYYSFLHTYIKLENPHIYRMKACNLAEMLEQDSLLKLIEE